MIEIELKRKNKPFCPACGSAAKIVARESINMEYEALIIACPKCCLRYQVSREVE